MRRVASGITAAAAAVALVVAGTPASADKDDSSTPQSSPSVGRSQDSSAGEASAKEQARDAVQEAAEAEAAREQAAAIAAATADLQNRLNDAQVTLTRAQRKAADAHTAATEAGAAVVEQEGVTQTAQEVVGRYARAAYQAGPTDLTVAASLLDSDSPQDLLDRADSLERVGVYKDTEYDAARLVLERAQAAADAAARAAQMADDVVASRQAAVTGLQAQLSHVTAQWATVLVGQQEDTAARQAQRNAHVATSWSAYTLRLTRWGAPTVTTQQIRSGRGLPRNVHLPKRQPGVAVWTPTRGPAKGQRVPLLPDDTQAAVTHAVSSLGAGYKWQTNTAEVMDCAALLDRAWNVPGMPANRAGDDRPVVTGGVRGIAADMRLLPAGDRRVGDVVFYRDGRHGVNHAGVLVTPRIMIAADAATGAVNAVPVDTDRVWRTGRPSAAPTKPPVRVPGVSKHATRWQCGTAPHDAAVTLSGGGQWALPTKSDDWSTETANPTGTDPGMRVHPVYGYARCHEGWDIANLMADPVYAAADGIATTQYNAGGAGNMVTIAHGDGVESMYMHLSAFAPGLDIAKPVKRGELVGYVGSTGASTGPHLHFQVNVNGVAMDPRHWILPNYPLLPACG